MVLRSTHSKPENSPLPAITRFPQVPHPFFRAELLEIAPKLQSYMRTEWHLLCKQGIKQELIRDMSPLPRFRLKRMTLALGEIDCEKDGFKGLYRALVVISLKHQQLRSICQQGSISWVEEIGRRIEITEHTATVYEDIIDALSNADNQSADRLHGRVAGWE